MEGLSIYILFICGTGQAVLKPMTRFTGNLVASALLNVNFSPFHLLSPCACCRALTFAVLYDRGLQDGRPAGAPYCEMRRKLAGFSSVAI